jgi:hypothetical protein
LKLSLEQLFFCIYVDESLEQYVAEIRPTIQKEIEHDGALNDEYVKENKTESRKTSLTDYVV